MPQLPWYDSLDPKLAERLLRPSVQPGVIDRRLVNGIFARSQWFNSRLSLLNYLTARHSEEPIQTDSVPIVYAQPVLQSPDATSSTASRSVSPLSPSPSLTRLPLTPSSSESSSLSSSSFSSLPLLAPENNLSPTPLPANQRTIVQAKFINSTSPAGVNPVSTVSPTSTVNSTSTVNPISISNSTAELSNPIVSSIADLPSVNQSSIPTELSDLPFTSSPLKTSSGSQQNTPLIQPQIPAISTHTHDLAIASATDLPMIQQRPESVAIRNSDVTPDRKRQRVDRIPPLPPLHRLPDPIEASPAAETTIPAEPTPVVQIQRKLDREQATSQPVQTPQGGSEPPLVYAQPMQPESSPLSLPHSHPDRSPAVQRVTLTTRSQLSSGHTSPRSQSPAMRSGVVPPAATRALLVVQPLVVPPAERVDRAMIYSHTSGLSRAADRVASDSSAAIRAIAASPLTPHSTQANPLDPGQAFNWASTVTNEQSANPPQPIPAQPSIPPQQPAIDINGLTEKIQRKLLRQLTVETERRGHASWR